LELEEKVKRLEIEAKKHAETLSMEVKNESQRAAECAVAFLQNEAIPKVVEGLSNAVQMLTPRDCDNTAAHEAIASMRSLVQDALPEVLHPHVICDGCEMSPILGARHKKKGHNFDLCKGCFGGLQQGEKAMFERIQFPGGKPVDMNTDVADVTTELESRHGWSSDAIHIVQNSRLVATVEAMRSAMPIEMFEEMTAALEPVFQLNQEYLANAMKRVEPMVAAILHDPYLLQRLPEMVRQILADPASLAQEEGGTPVLMDISGDYECHMYDETEHKNEWHHVTISINQDRTSFAWRNAAGAVWTLFPTHDALVYRVGEDCPYFISGHTETLLEVDGSGTVANLLGPCGEPYTIKAAMAEPGLSVHAGIWCDVCGMKPIVGERYMQQLPHDTYDMCQRCYQQLDHGKKAELQQVLSPNPAPEVTEVAINSTEIEPVETECTVEVGPIWNCAHSHRVAAEYVAAHPTHKWSGHWWTTVPKELSVLAITVPAGTVVDQTWRPAVIEADPEVEVTSPEQAAAEEAPACTLQGALVQMGVAEADLSASIIAGIEHMVQDNAQAAEEAAVKESAAQAAAETEAQAAAQAVAIAEAEAQAAAQAVAEAEAQAAAAEAASAEAVKAAAEAQAAAAMVQAAAEPVADDPFMLPLVEQLCAMGFPRSVAASTLAASSGDLAQAVEKLLASPQETFEEVQTFEEVPEPDTLSEDSTEWNQDWDELLAELDEMGFGDSDANREILSLVSGDVKDAVKELVNRERLARE